MRTFFLGNEVLTRCGNKTGSGKGGIAYLCPTCGQTWGRVELAWMEWMAARIPCGECGTIAGYGGCPGSFLKPLSWWDSPNGESLTAQLLHADKTLLLYETQRHIAWIIGKHHDH